MKLETNVLYYGDNLDVLRKHIPDESIDLIYLDPPFNSNRSYNVLFKESSGAGSEAQLEAFEDAWHWGPHAQEAYEEIQTGPHQAVARVVRAMVEGLTHNDVTAYLSMMAIRLVELHRVLKPTGSIYLHCDPTASHYLKVLMDSVFGPANFVNEIIWQRTGAHNDARRWGRVTDTILFLLREEQRLDVEHGVRRLLGRLREGALPVRRRNNWAALLAQYHDCGGPWTSAAVQGCAQGSSPRNTLAFLPRADRQNGNRRRNILQPKGDAVR